MVPYSEGYRFHVFLALCSKVCVKRERQKAVRRPFKMSEGHNRFTTACKSTKTPFPLSPSLMPKIPLVFYCVYFFVLADLLIIQLSDLLHISVK